MICYMAKTDGLLKIDSMQYEKNYIQQMERQGYKSCSAIAWHLNKIWFACKSLITKKEKSSVVINGSHAKIFISEYRCVIKV